MNLTQVLCGSSQTKTAILFTFLPWLLVFGGLNIALLLFPSWLMPFSNTIGYFLLNYLICKKYLIIY